MNIKGALKWGILALLVVAGGIALGGMTYIYKQVSAFDKVFADGIFVNGVDIGGFSRTEAKQKILSQISNGIETRNLIIYKGEVSYKIPFNDLGSEFNIDEVLDKAYEVGHQGNMFEKFEYLRTPQSQTQTFDLNYIYDKEKIHSVIEAYTPKFHVNPVNATIERKNRKFIITPEKEGQELDLVPTIEKVFSALDKKYDEDVKVEAVIKKISAKYTVASFDDIQNMIASFSTSYNNSDANRNVNLEVAASKINTMLLPDEVFSLGKQLEPISFAAGYRNSKVIANGKIELGIGGGVCQIASTLYNSLLLTNLEVISRQNHSLPVAYVPLGRDATYSSNSIDFKFKNNTKYPLFVEGYCENNKVYVNIFAHPSAKADYEVKFDSVTTEVINPPAPKYVDDATLLKGTKVEELKALSGKKVKLYRLYYSGGNLVKKELINNSYYRPRGALIRVGTKENTTPAFNPQSPDMQTSPTGDPMIDDPAYQNFFIPDSTINDLVVPPDVINEVIE